MTTATRTRKPRPRPARECRLTAGVNGVRILQMTVTTPRVTMEPKVEHFGYFLTEIPADFGRGFKLEKYAPVAAEGEPTSYEVNLDTFNSTCDCMGNQRWGLLHPCKHISALLALKAAGKL